MSQNLLSYGCWLYCLNIEGKKKKKKMYLLWILDQEKVTTFYDNMTNTL